MVSDDQPSSRRSLDATDVLGQSSRLVGGKYRLGKLLGEGGMGSVYEAEHTGLGTTVALKLLNEVFAADPSALTRFRREARAAAAVRHPNIVAVTDAGTDSDGVPFIAMELVSGESLSALLRRERVLSTKDTVVLTQQLLAGLAAAHAKGVIHRDLKPGNVLVETHADGSRQLKILDFGVSKFFRDVAHNVTATGAVVGTPRFMSPEQAKGQSDIDSRVDIYAVGVLVYRMVTGKLPFIGTTQDQIIAQIIAGEAKRPTEVRPDVPLPLEAVIMTAMAPKREDRFPDARTFMEALQEAAPEVPVSITGLLNPSASSTPLTPTDGSATRDPGGSTAPQAPQALRRQRPARPLRRLLPLAIASVALGATAGWWWHSRPTQTRPPTQRPLAAGAPASPLKFATIRYVPARQLRDEFASLVEYLATRLGRRVDLVVVEDYADLASRLEQGSVQLASLSACDYVRARKHPAIELLATHRTTSGATYQGHILTRAESGLQSLPDLAGKKFCYVNPKSCAGYLFPRAAFRQQGIDPDRSFSAIIFSGDHPRAMRYLQSGVCDGAAVAADVYLDSERHGLLRDQFHIAASTRRIPWDAYCGSKQSPPGLNSALRDALLRLAPRSQQALRTLGPNSRITGFVRVSDSDYDSVRQVEGLDNESESAPAPPAKKKPE